MKSIFPFRRKVNTPLPWRGRENGGPQRETKEREAELERQGYACLHVPEGLLFLSWQHRD